MSRTAKVVLADHTTLGVGGPAGRFVRAAGASDLIGLIAAADTEGTQVLIIGAGSNLLISDEGFPGLVIRTGYSDGTVTELADGRVLLDYGAGQDFDELVTLSVESGWSGIEALAGIPGTLGAAPMQNIGAYGQEIRETVRSVSVYDRQLRRTRQFGPEDCGFAYRDSIFKGTDRYAILSVQLCLRRSALSQPVRYAELAARLGVQAGESAPLKDVREAVLELRRGKGMVLDPGDPDTRSAGSFFLNPVLPAEAAHSLPDAAPRWPAGDGNVKLSAAWLIEQAGFTRGWSGNHLNVSLSNKHTLAITNRGGAKASDIIGLASEIAGGVLDRFGVRLTPEPRLVGLELPSLERVT